MLDYTDSHRQPGEFTRFFAPYLAAGLYLNGLPEATSTAPADDDFEKFWSQVEHLPLRPFSLSGNSQCVAPSVQEMLDDLASQIIGQQRRPHSDAAVPYAKDNRPAIPTHSPDLLALEPSQPGASKMYVPAVPRLPDELELEGGRVPEAVWTSPPPTAPLGVQHFVLTASIALTVAGVLLALVAYIAV